MDTLDLNKGSAISTLIPSRTPDVAAAPAAEQAAGGRHQVVPSAAPPVRRLPLAVGLVAVAVLGGTIAVTEGARLAVLYLLGAALGVTLFHARFGFTSAWRQLVSVGQGRALRAHALMLGVACVLFAPILSLGIGVSGSTPQGSVSPIGVSLVVGSLLFGVGMQVGGSCASGTLFSVGSGQTAILFTLGGFVVGSVLGAWHFAFWTSDLPSFAPVSLAESRLGYGGAVAATLAALASVAGLTVLLARRRRPPEIGAPPRATGWARAIRGSWPLWVGALLLAGLNAATLVISGKAWGITSAFALWGSKIAQALGVDVSSWGYWRGTNGPSLNSSVLHDVTSVMDFGIILGALVASAAAGTFLLHRRVPGRLALGAVLGGVLMGYGARIAYGCNIGAYFDGIASFSLHGWIWGVLAVVGTAIGLKLRPLFGLANPKPGDAVC